MRISTLVGAAFERRAVVATTNSLEVALCLLQHRQVEAAIEEAVGHVQVTDIALIKVHNRSAPVTEV